MRLSRRASSSSEFCLGLHVLEPEYALYFFGPDHVGEIFTKPGEGDVGCGIGGDVAAFVEESEECSEALRLSADRAWGDAVACEACHPGSDVVEGNVGGANRSGLKHVIQSANWHMSRW